MCYVFFFKIQTVQTVHLIIKTVRLYVATVKTPFQTRNLEMRCCKRTTEIKTKTQSSAPWEGKLLTMKRKTRSHLSFHQCRKEDEWEVGLHVASLIKSNNTRPYVNEVHVCVSSTAAAETSGLSFFHSGAAMSVSSDHRPCISRYHSDNAAESNRCFDYYYFFFYHLTEAHDPVVAKYQSLYTTLSLSLICQHTVVGLK